MDRNIWKTVTAAIRKASRVIKPSVRDPIYSDFQIVAMYFWSVWHDRCLSWACSSNHYGRLFRPRKLPSVSQFIRRIKTDSCQKICQHIHDQLAASDLNCPVMMIDGKALPVSPVSKDIDAKRGRIPGGFAKGYKLHACVSETRRIVLWSLMPLNFAEQTAARKLISCLPTLSDFPACPMLLADSNYDSADLYKLACGTGRQFLAPLKAQGFVKGAKHLPHSLTAMGPARRAALEIWNTQPALARLVHKARGEIERVLGTLVCHGGGLGPLPAWVRTLTRVRRWVGAKIILYHARLKVQEGIRQSCAFLFSGDWYRRKPAPR